MNRMTFDYLALRNEINPFSEPKPNCFCTPVSRFIEASYQAERPSEVSIRYLSRKTELYVQLSLAEILMEQGDYSSAREIVDNVTSLAQGLTDAPKVLKQCESLAALIRSKFN